MEAHESEPEHHQRSSNVPVILIGAFFLMVGYVLSPPFVFLFFSDPGDPVFEAIYAPLIYLADNSELVQDFYIWYGQLFPWV